MSPPTSGSAAAPADTPASAMEPPELSEPDGMLAYALAMEKPDRNDPNWPLPSFDARDWAEAFVSQFPEIDEGTAFRWFANALMRGFDEHARRAASGSLPGGEREALAEAIGLASGVVTLIEGAKNPKAWPAFWADCLRMADAALSAPPPPAAEPEPVAWALVNGLGQLSAAELFSDKERAEREAARIDGWSAVPLYTAPQPGGAEAKELRREVAFLLARIDDLPDAEDEDYVRDWNGHICPSLERLRMLLAPPPGDAQEAK